MPSEPITQFEAASALVAGSFGLELERFSANIIEVVLDSLRLIDAEPGSSLDRVVAACSVGETMFLRQPEHFQLLGALRASLPASAAQRPVRAWSAGCASGEEAYGLAAELGAALGDCEVLGTDLNPALIERARLGQYGRWSLRGIACPASLEWLALDGARVSVRESIRRCVRFGVHNLAVEPFPGGWDVVFLRNVLIYFHKEAASQVYARMAEAVLPGGLLFIADFDPEPPVEGPWEREVYGEIRCFRRRKLAEEREPLAPRPLHSPVFQGGREDVLVGAAAQASGRAQVAKLLATAEALEQQGQWQQALASLSEAARAHPLEVSIYTLTAMIASEAGRACEALEAARRAVCLAPNEPLALYLYGISLQDTGERRRGAMHLRQAAEALAGASDTTALGDALTVGELRRMIHVRVDDRCG